MREKHPGRGGASGKKEGAMNAINEFFVSAGFMPRGYGFPSSPIQLWVDAISDVVITLSCYAIAVVLWIFARRRTALSFSRPLLMSAFFVFADGTTHLTSVLNIWQPDYWLATCVKAVTAIASLATVALVWPVTPKALALPGANQPQRANDDTLREVAAPRKATEHLHALTITPIQIVESQYFSGFLRDIAARNETERALRDSEKRFRATFQQAAVGIAHVAPDGRWLRVNEKLCDIVGYTREELLSLTFQDITHPDDLGADLAQVRQVLDGQIDTYTMEKRYLRKGGSEVWIALTVSLVRDDAGTPDYFISVVEDIQRRKVAEEELRERTAELARSNQDLEQFAYIASHDLQEPLRAVSGSLQLLKRRYEGKLDPRADEFIGHAVDGAVRMSALIGDLLAYSRVGRREDPRQLTECDEALSSALKNLSVAVRETGAQVTRGSLPTVLANSTQLTLLFQNLVGNAIKFRRQDVPVQIHVGAEARDDAWVFRVADNGIGIEPQYFERIFLVFQRLHTRQDYPGTGIGLALCKRIVERHCGHIWVESEPGKGSTFLFTLPRDPV
ncbi:hypothetical protein WJ68_04825 [Burkholderia ubonensis]|uniref:histidine kinase n=2 Tax=Burkholderia ubonensis TaxID=101571 RepID=A0ABD4E651_9BURK|nr:hypothetical protein WJ68_04825 [Burkholderia ubonensis]